MLQEAAWGKACKVEGPHFRDLGMRSVTWNKVQEMAAWMRGLETHAQESVLRAMGSSRRCFRDCEVRGYKSQPRSS